jgi:malyl-CoA/(S)-citramalyl-CoA lyase
MRHPREFFRPLAVGAPEPVREVPPRPSRMIHFFDPSNPAMTAKVLDLAPSIDVILGNLEDAVPASRKAIAREGLIRTARSYERAGAELWVRINSLDSPWVLDDLTSLVTDAGERIDVIMVPKVRGPEDIHYLDRLLAQLEAKAGISRPLQLHAILETASGVAQVSEIARSSPRMQGISLGPADLAADRRMKVTQVGGGHPGYLVREEPPSGRDGERLTGAHRRTYQQDLWHHTLAVMVDACVEAEISPYYGPFGDIADSVGCEDQFRNAYVLGCVGAWTLHPSQIDIARRVFSPSLADVAWARRVVDAMADDSAVVMIDGKMQDDASVKMCQVTLDLAQRLSETDPELKERYGL